MKTISILLMIALLAISSFACDMIRISGRVTDASGTALSRVKIYGFDQVVTTNQFGFYSMDVPNCSVDKLQPITLFYAFEPVTLELPIKGTRSVIEVDFVGIPMEKLYERKVKGSN